MKMKASRRTETVIPVVWEVMAREKLPQLQVSSILSQLRLGTSGVLMRLHDG